MDVTVLVVGDADTDEEETDRLTRRLRTELSELDTGSVTLATGGSVPDGPKGVDAAAVDAIVVALGGAGGIFPAVVETVREWLSRQSGRHKVAVTIDGDTIELDAATADQQRALVNAFVLRHTGG